MSVRRKRMPGCRCCARPPCVVTLVVRGCHDAPLPGATVSVATSGGPTTSGTTDASGAVALSIPSGVPYTIAVDGGVRFAPWSFSGADCAAPGPPATASLSPAAGYHCWPAGASCASGSLGACPYPIADTIHGTDSVLGSATLAYNPAVGCWEGTSTYDYPGQSNIAGPVCLAGAVTLSWFFGADPGTYAAGADANGVRVCAGLWWPQTVGPDSGLCPRVAGTSDAGIPSDAGDVAFGAFGQSCPPSTLLTYDFTVDTFGYGTMTRMYSPASLPPNGSTLGTRTFTE